MDHPGFVAQRMVDSHTLEAAFRGSVLVDYLRGQCVRFFAGGAEVAGMVTRAESAKGSPWASKAQVRVREPVPANAIGMFDQGVGRFKGKKFYSRACDDLAGLAGALEMLDQLAGEPLKTPVAVLLTRAEEEGFVGAIAAARDRKLLRKDDRLIAIEISAKQPYARQGDGAIIRVGDRTSIFDSAITYFLTQQAEELKKRDKTFKFQRALMPGGTCEATVYDAYGFAAGSICCALGNYHNMDQEKKKIGPEYIDVDDWRNMVKLFLAVARAGHQFEPGHGVLRQRVEKRFATLEPLLATPEV
jgi:endoglucanase